MGAPSINFIESVWVWLNWSGSCLLYRLVWVASMDLGLVEPIKEMAALFLVWSGVFGLVEPAISLVDEWMGVDGWMGEVWPALFYVL